MKNLITAASVIALSLVSLPAVAGEAFVRNTDVYSNSRSNSTLYVKGNRVYKGHSTEYAGAFKFEEFDRDTNVYLGDKQVDVDAGIAGSKSGFVSSESFAGYDSYSGKVTTSTHSREYTWETSGGVR